MTADERKAREEWLASLKPGDPVWTAAGEWRVEKITRAHGGAIVTGRGNFDRTTGIERGRPALPYGIRERIMPRKEYEERKREWRKGMMAYARRRIALNPEPIREFLDVCEHYNLLRSVEMNGARIVLEKIVAEGPNPKK